MIPYGRQSISEEDIAAVVEVLRSDWLTQGPAVSRFEEAVAGYCGAQHGVAVSNATAGLHLACLALGLGPGDLLWTSPITFVASANCGRYCGADVDFVDMDPRTCNISVSALRDKLKRAERLPKVVVAVHFSGQSCEMAEIRALSRQYGFYVIEDAAHAIGADYRGTKVGSGEYSDITVFSFHPVKVITTGEGGMVMTNSSELHQRLVELRSHGISRDPARMRDASEGGWYYQQLDLGYNFRMTDIQAALGWSQLQRLDQFVARRRELAQWYDAGLAGLPLLLPWQHPDSSSAWHLYVIRLDPALSPLTRRQLYERLQQAGIGVNVHYIPVHLQPYYRDLGFNPGDFPEAERYYSAALTLPLFPVMRDSDQERVIEQLHKELL